MLLSIFSDLQVGEKDIEFQMASLKKTLVMNPEKPSVLYIDLLIDFLKNKNVPYQIADILSRKFVRSGFNSLKDAFDYCCNELQYKRNNICDMSVPEILEYRKKQDYKIMFDFVNSYINNKNKTGEVILKLYNDRINNGQIKKITKTFA